MEICEICGKECTSVRGLLQHIRKAHLSNGEVRKIAEPYTAYKLYLEFPSGRRITVTTFGD